MPAIDKQQAEELFKKVTARQFTHAVSECDFMIYEITSGSKLSFICEIYKDLRVEFRLENTPGATWHYVIPCENMDRAKAVLKEMADNLGANCAHELADSCKLHGIPLPEAYRVRHKEESEKYLNGRIRVLEEELSECRSSLQALHPIDSGE